MPGKDKAGELSYFSTALRTFLRESHPQLRDNEKFIRDRSQAAEQTFTDSLITGSDRYAAMEQANSVLYADLRFSKYDTVYNIVAEWFPEIVPEHRTAFCLSILSQCEQVFELYEIGDDFEATGQYNNLQIELTGFIQLKIEENGI